MYFILGYGCQKFFQLFFWFCNIRTNFLKNSIIKVGKIQFLTYTGKISYGVYLLHMVSIYIINHICQMISFIIPVVIQNISIIILTYIISYLSYNYFEKPFIKFKKKFDTA